MKSTSSHAGHKQRHPLGSHSVTPSAPRRGNSASCELPAQLRPTLPLTPMAAAARRSERGSRPALTARAALRAEHRRPPRPTARAAGSAPHRRCPRETRSSAVPRRVSVSGGSGFARTRHATPFPAPRGRETAPRRGAAEHAGRAAKGTRPSEPAARGAPGAHVPAAPHAEPPSPPVPRAVRPAPLIPHPPARPSPSCGAGRFSRPAGLWLGARRTVHGGSAECRSTEGGIRRREAGRRRIFHTHLQSRGEDSPRFRRYILPIFRTCREASIPMNFRAPVGFSTISPNPPFCS